jgi:K+ transporter
MQLGYCPRIRVKFTSEREKGQIYVPNINWLLLAAVIVVVLGFRSSSNLASAYGIAVTLTMMIDTLLAFVVVRALWHWSWPRAALFLVFFVVVDIAFFSANVIKILDGGWFPLALGLSVFVLLSTWKLGRRLLYEKLEQDTIPLDAFITSLEAGGPHRVDGTGVFLTANPDGVPRALLHNLYHNKVLHQRVVLLHVDVEDVPRVAEPERVRVEAFPAGFYRVFVRYGFKDEADLPQALELCAGHGLSFEMMETSFFLGPRDDRHHADCQTLAHGPLAAGPVHLDVPQRRPGDSLLQDPAEPGGRAGCAGRAVVALASRLATACAFPGSTRLPATAAWPIIGERNERPTTPHHRAPPLLPDGRCGRRRTALGARRTGQHSS